MSPEPDIDAPGMALVRPVIWCDWPAPVSALLLQAASRARLAAPMAASRSRVCMNSVSFGCAWSGGRGRSRAAMSCAAGRSRRQTHKTEEQGCGGERLAVCTTCVADPSDAGSGTAAKGIGDAGSWPVDGRSAAQAITAAALHVFALGQRSFGGPGRPGGLLRGAHLVPRGHRRRWLCTTGGATIECMSGTETTAASASAAEHAGTTHTSAVHPTKLRDACQWCSLAWCWCACSCASPCSWWAMSSGAPPIVASIWRPPVRKNRASRTAASSRNTMLSQVV